MNQQFETVEVDSIIRTARKLRQPKACYPCYKRKVKCDRGRPCTTCSERNHIDLCSYQAGERRQSIPFSDNASVASGEIPSEDAQSQITISRPEWDRLQSELHSLRAQSLLILDLQQQVRDLQEREAKFNAMIKMLKARQQAVRKKSSSETREVPTRSKLITADSVLDDANILQPEQSIEYPMYLSARSNSCGGAQGYLR